MTPPDPTVRDESARADTSEPHSPGTPGAPGAEPVRSSRLGIWSVAVALVAGVVAWRVGESRWIWVPAKELPAVTMGARHLAATPETVHAATAATAARSYGVLGAALGCGLGLVGGLVRRSRRRALTAALVGAGLGAACGLVASYGAVPLFYRYERAFANDLIAAMVLHGTIWGALGASSALAFVIGAGIGRTQAIRCVGGGIMGALAGTVVFELLGAVLFASDSTTDPISASAGSRLMARLLVAGCVAFGVNAALNLSASGVTNAHPDAPGDGSGCDGR